MSAVNRRERALVTTRFVVLREDEKRFFVPELNIRERSSSIENHAFFSICRSTQTMARKRLQPPWDASNYEQNLLDATPARKWSMIKNKKPVFMSLFKVGHLRSLMWHGWKRHSLQMEPLFLPRGCIPKSSNKRAFISLICPARQRAGILEWPVQHPPILPFANSANVAYENVKSMNWNVTSRYARIKSYAFLFTTPPPIPNRRFVECEDRSEPIRPWIHVESLLRSANRLCSGKSHCS